MVGLGNTTKEELIRAYRQNLRDKIIAGREQGLSGSVLARRYGVTVRTVERYWKRYRESGQSCAKPMGCYRRSKLADHDATLEAWIQERNDISMAELQQRCAEELGVGISINALWYRLKRLGLSYKKNDARRRARPA